VHVRTRRPPAAAEEITMIEQPATIDQVEQPAIINQADQVDQVEPIETAGTDETRLILPPINHAAPGSRKLEKERRRLADAWILAREDYNETVDDVNEARDQVIAYPDNADAAKQLEKDLERLNTQRKRLNQVREDYHAYLISRMVTNDGTSVDEALDRISQNDFDALVTLDVESVVIPKPTAGS
jgi:hypothetical protein